MIPSPVSLRVLYVTLALGGAGYVTGVVAGLVWVHPLVAFGAFLAVAVASMQLHHPRGRVAGVAVDAVRLVREAA